MQKDTKTEEKKKVVFILGAGFSVDAGAPKQSEILRKVLARNTENAKELRQFVTSTFASGERIPLEDLFTALDRSIQRDECLQQYRLTNFGSNEQEQKPELIYIREVLLTEMAKMFRQELIGEDKEYVNSFASSLIDWRLDKKDEDQVAVLSLNWDLLLDNSLGRIMDNDARCSDGEKRNMFIDHCMMDKQLFREWNIPPSLTIKAKGFINFKLLKLHGSFNWLRCPNCDSVFVGFGDKYAARLDDPNLVCWVCDDNFNSEQRLRPFILSPTFLKDLNNVHYRSIWWNAGFELAEASHIVFLGYSLPLADFEFRYLLSRFVQHNVAIRVVDWHDNTSGQAQLAHTTKQRYKDFFGSRLKDEHFFFLGAKEYCKQIQRKSIDQLFDFIETDNLRSRERQLRAMLKNKVKE